MWCMVLPISKSLLRFRTFDKCSGDASFFNYYESMCKIILHVFTNCVHDKKLKISLLVISQKKKKRTMFGIYTPQVQVLVGGVRVKT